MCVYEILYIYAHLYIYIFPDSSVGKEFACERPKFDSWVGKIPWRRDVLPTPVFLGFPCGSAGKESACKAGDLGSIPGLGRSPGEGKGYPLQFSGLENSMDNPWGRKESDTTERLSLSLHIYFLSIYRFPGGSVVKNPQTKAGDAGSVIGLGRSSGGGNGNPLQESCLRNPMDRRVWWAVVHTIVAKESGVT